MKKRIISLFLMAVMSISLLSGCGDMVSSYSAVMPTDQEQAEIYVEKIDGLSQDFIKGMDISSLLVEEASGVKYYNENGEEEDLLKILADSGVNYVRVRVWNDPFDKDGNGYGGGNCDVNTAAEIGKRAAKYGIKLCVDFHYSDFWADPNKQFAPKAWSGMSTEEKADELYKYTKESLTTIIDAGADVGMVQIGNEINNGMSGEKSMNKVLELLASGSKGVREVAADKKQDIKVVVHYTQIDNPENTLKIAGQLADAGLDYDVFGVSYYCYWHGTMDNMTQVLSDIKNTYGVDTCIMETSYMWTKDDGDESGNSLSAADALDEYPCTPQGQANCVRDVMAHAAEADSLGVFYWEGAWVPVGRSYATNSPIWEEFGSGWASSFAGAYDPNDAGQYYGGCSWDNQAMFDFSGKKLPSLDVYKYVNYGAVGNGIEVLQAKNVNLEIGIGEELILPDTVEAVYNDTSCKDPLAVTWDAAAVGAIDTAVAGTYQVAGTCSDGTKVTADIKVCNINYLLNPGFEDTDASMWQIVAGNAGATDIQDKAADALSGTKAFHFYDESAVDFSVEQTITGLKSGKYNAVANMQGGDVGADAQIYLYVQVGDVIYTSDPIVLDGWQHWKNATITDVVVTEGDEVHVGLAVKCAAKGWGTADDFEFYCQQ